MGTKVLIPVFNPWLCKVAFVGGKKQIKLQMPFKFFSTLHHNFKNANYAALCKQTHN